VHEESILKQEEMKRSFEDEKNQFLAQLAETRSCEERAVYTAGMRERQFKKL